jgi:sulfur-oxidizing protein SoxA
MRAPSFISFTAAALALAAITMAATRAAPAAERTDPAADAKAFRDYFVKKFPKAELDDFVNGPYSMNKDMRKQWEEMEQFSALRIRARCRQGNVRKAVQERQDLCRLL